MKQRTAAELAAKQVAYSLIEIKGIDEEKRIIEGIASTPTPDRMEDIVEPLGAEFSLPLPFLWQHNSREPIGHVIAAKPNKNGIPVTIRVERAGPDDPASLRELLDVAWAMIKKRLVRGLSIGFQPLEWSEIKGTYGFRYVRWSWLELSAVTIAAQAEATITAIKSADQPHLRAASGERGVVVVRAVTSPGASGKPQFSKRSTEVKTIKEQMAAFEARRAANAAAATEIMQKSSEKGETLTADEQEKFDEMNAEIKQLDAHLERLRVAEKLNVEKAAVIDNDAGTDPDKAAKNRIPAGSGIRVETKLEPGVRFARMAMAIARAKSQNVGISPEQFYRSEKRWMDSAPEVALALKSAVNAGDSTTAGWASELAYAQNIASEFIEFLRPRTLIGRIQGWRTVPFNVRVGSQTAGATGYWVGQGKPIPMSKLTTSSVSLGIAKVAGLVSIDKELARLSSPSAEMMVRNDLAAECQKVLDLSLIDPNQGGQTNIQPASLTYGLTPVTPSGTNYAAFCTDVKSLFSTAIAAQLDVSKAVWVISPTTALALSLMVTSLGNPQFPGLTINGGTLMGLPVFVSTQAKIAGSPQYDTIMALIFPGEVFLADDGQANVEASDQVSIQMDDAPTNASTATATGTSVVSMFQTESIAVKAVRYINWAKARSQACAFIQAAAYA